MNNELPPDAVVNTAIYAVTPQGITLARNVASALLNISTNSLPKKRLQSCTLFLPERFSTRNLDDAEDANSAIQPRHANETTHSDSTSVPEQSFQSLTRCVAKTFHAFTQHIFITATGIAVRSIAPHLEHKNTDPAVVVCDQKGAYAISLLSGHLGGANTLAHTVATVTGGVAVITTATDTEQLPSIDIIAQQNGCTMHNVEAVKHINGALLAGEPVLIDDPADMLQLQNSPYATLFRFSNPADMVMPETGVEDDFGSDPTAMPEQEAGTSPQVIVSWRHPNFLETGDRTLILHPPVLHVGIGCKRGTFADDIESFLNQTLEKNRIALGSVTAFATVSAKADERGITELAANRNTPLVFFAAEELDIEKVPNPSLAPANAIGTRSVAEAAALCSAKRRTGKARLVLEKTKTDSITLAVALEIP